MTEGPLGRLRENAVEVVSMTVTAVWLGALFTDQEWWLAALIVGYVFVVPLAKILAGEDDEEDDAVEAGETAEAETTASADPLETLRRRYAEGELTEVEFERKVERLLATEDEDDAEALLDAEIERRNAAERDRRGDADTR